MCARAGECLCGFLNAGIPRFPALNRVNSNYRYNGLNRAVVCDVEENCPPSVVLKP